MNKEGRGKNMTQIDGPIIPQYSDSIQKIE